MPLITYGVDTPNSLTASPGRASTGTISVALPTSWQVGQLAIMLVYNDAGDASTPTGWTELTGSPFGSNTPKLCVFYKFLVSGETDPVVTTISGSSGTLSHQAAIATFNNVDSIEVIGTATSGTGTPMTAGTISSLTANSWILVVGGRGDNDQDVATYAAMTGGTPTARFSCNTSQGDDSGTFLGSYEKASTGATGGASVTASVTDPYIEVILALKPIQFFSISVNAPTAVAGTSQAIGKQKRIAVGQTLNANETETETFGELEITVKKRYSIAVGQVTETKTVQSITAQRKYSVGQAGGGGGGEVTGAYGNANESLAQFDEYADLTLDANAKHSGTYGFKVPFNGTLNEIVGDIYNGGVTSDIYARAYVYIPSGKEWGVTDGDPVGVLLHGLTNSFGTPIYLWFCTNDITGEPDRWRLETYGEGATGSSTDYTDGFALDTWICVEIRAVINGTSSGGQLWVNGNLVSTKLDCDHTGANWDRTRFGKAGGGIPANGAYIYLDDMVVHSSYIGVLSLAGEVAQVITAQKVSGHNVDVGQTTNTNTSGSVAVTKRIAVGQNAETELSQAIGKQKRISLNQATETELSQSVSKWKRLALNQTTETDTLQSIGKKKTLSVGQLTTTNTAQSISVSVPSGVSQVVETDTSQSIGKQKRLSVSQSTGTDLAQSVGKQKRIGVVQITETELSQSIGKQKRKGVGQNTETELSQSVSKQKRLSVNQSAETNASQNITKQGSQTFVTVYPVGAFVYLQDENGVYLFDENGVPLYVEAQSDFAQIITAQKVGGHNINVTQVTNTNASQAIGKQKRISVLQATNTNLSQSIGKQKRISVGQIVNANSSVAVAPARKKPVGQTTENDSSGQLGKTKRCALTTATEPDSAFYISTLVAGVVQPAVESDTSQSIVASKRIPVEQISDSNSAGSLGRIKNKGIRLAENRIDNGYDWIDSDSDGLADWWNKSAGNGIATIVEGNGFSGRAQRYEATWGLLSDSLFYQWTQFQFVAGKKYQVSLKYRSNGNVHLSALFDDFAVLPPNTGQAIEFSSTFISPGGSVFNVQLEKKFDWFEIDDIHLQICDASLAVGKKKIVQLGGVFPITNSDYVLSIQPIKRILVNQVADTNTADGIVPMGVFGQVAETDQALSIQSVKRKNISGAVELDFGLQLFTILKKFNIRLVNEHDNCVFISKPGDEIIDVGMVIDFNKAFPARLFNEELLDIHDIEGVIIDRMPEGETFDFPLKVSYANKHNLTAYLVDADGKYFIDADGKQFLTADLVMTNESIKGEIL